MKICVRMSVCATNLRTQSFVKITFPRNEGFGAGLSLYLGRRRTAFKKSHTCGRPPRIMVYHGRLRTKIFMEIASAWTTVLHQDVIFLKKETFSRKSHLRERCSLIRSLSMCTRD